MPAINFHAQFADAVKRGEKRQTIRARGKRNPPRVGDPLFLYTGMRTAACRKLATVVCAAVTPITISVERRSVTMPDLARNIWRELDGDEIKQVARADGFASADEFFEWFRANHGATMSGYLIRWD